jgi:hypothetical protein
MVKPQGWWLADGGHGWTIAQGEPLRLHWLRFPAPSNAVETKPDLNPTYPATNALAAG